MHASSAQTKTLFLLFKFLIEFGFSCGFFSATSLFLNRVGAFSLFYIYLGSSLLALGLSFLFSRIIDKFSRRLIFFSSFMVLGALVVASWLLVRNFEHSAPLYFGIRIFAYSILVLTALEFGVLTSLSFTHSEAKKIFSHLAIVSVLGEMSGGIFIGLTSQWFHTENFLLVWGLILCLAPLLFWKVRFPAAQTAGFSTAVVWGEIQSPGTGLRSRAFLKNRVVLLLLGFWVAYSFFCYGTDYVFNSFAAQRIQGEDALTAFFGKVSAVASIGVLLYHLFIAPRLLHRLGVAQNLFVISAVLLLPWVIFSLHPSLITIAIVQGMIYFFTEHFASGNFSTVLTLFPERVRGRIRVITEGFGRPLGTVLLFLLAAGFAFQMSVDLMTAVMLGGTAVFLAYPFIFKKPYLKHILNCLHSRDQSLVLNSIQALGESNDPSAVQPLADVLHQSNNEDLRRTAVLSLEHLDNPDAFREILPILSNPEDPLHLSALEGLIHCRDYQGIYTLLGLIQKSREADPVSRKRAMAILEQVLGRDLIPALLTALYEADPELKKEALLGLARFRERRLISVFHSFLKNPDPKISAAAAVTLFPFSHSRENVRGKALEAIARLYDSPAKADRIEAIEAIGTLKLHSYGGPLLELAESQDMEILQGVALALAQLREPNFTRPMIRVLLGEDEALAIATGKHFHEWPKWSQNFLLEKISALRDAQRTRAWERLKKTGLDFSEELGLRQDAEPILTATLHG